MICSRCGFSNNGLLPGFSCPSCGSVYSSEPAKKLSDKIQNSPLWESPYAKDYPLSAFVKTSKEILWSPDSFYRKLQSKSNLLSAWLYALISGSIGYVLIYLWAQFFPSMDVSMLSEETDSILSATNTSGALKLLYTPIYITLEILFLTVYTHFVLILTRKKKKSLQFTFKIVSYAQNALLLNFIPVAGSFLSAVFMLLQIITGIAHVHETTKFKAFIAMLMPLFLLLLFISVIVSAAMLLGIAATGYLENLIPFSGSQ